MDARKIISFGGNSYVVSVPKSWVKKNMLKKGDLLAVKENHDEIVFSVSNRSGKKEPRSVIIDSEKKRIDMIRAEITAAYLNNYDTIEIKSISVKENPSEIKEIIRNLSGLEIIMQDSKKIVAKDLLSMDDVSIKTIVRRMDTITKVMIDDSIECIDGNSNSDDIRQRDEDINRLHFLAYRVIRNQFQNPSSSVNLWVSLKERIIITKIEQVADTQKRIASYLCAINLTAKKKDELKKIYNLIRGSYIDVMKAYYNGDIAVALEVEISNKDRINMCDNFLINISQSFVIAKIIENLKAMSSSIKYIARMIIEGN